MSPKRYFVQRTAIEVRESAAALLERMERDLTYDGYGSELLLRAAKRVRKIPIAGFIGKKKP